jgi:hypothetical protein
VLEPPSVAVPERVMVRTPVEPEGESGPGGTVQVMTSTVGVEPPADGETLGPEPETPDPEPGWVTVSGCGDEPPALDPGAVTVGGCG